MKKKTSAEKISDALNVDPPQKKIVEAEVVEPYEIQGVSDDKRQQDLDKDYDTVRRNLIDIVNVGAGAIEGILAVASEGDNPRAYEVVSQMIKSVTDANKDLIDLHKQMGAIEGESSSQKASNITNNSIFVGSTKQLQDLVKNNFKRLEDDGTKR